jgi:hypothetical protein
MNIFKRYKVLLCLSALLVAATLLRFVLISKNWPTTNSDEATIDLMALHILTHGEHPIFYYGQSYMGSFEAYIGALSFRLFGVSLFSLRLGLLPLLIGFLISIYFLSSLLYSKRLGLIVVALLALGSSDVISHQFKAIGGYPETLLFGTLIFLLSSLLVLSRQSERITGNGRTWLYAALGLLIGFSLYTDPLDAPLVAGSVFLLFLFCRSELFSGRGALLLAMLIVGFSPLIVYNLRHTNGLSTLSYYIDMQQSGTMVMRQENIHSIQKLVGALFLTLPYALGITHACPQQAIPLFGPTQANTVACTLWHGSWSLGYWSLWTLAVILTGQTPWRIWRAKRRIALLLTDPQSTKPIIRLVLLSCAALSFLLYINNPYSALSPLPTTRYLITMVISAPALLWPLWQPFEQSLYQPSVALRSLCLLLLLIIGAATASGTLTSLSDLKDTAAFYHQQDDLIAHLQTHHATHIYSDYWTCNLLIFRSDEHIICGSLDEQLRPNQNRYPPYLQEVQAVAHPAYVFQANSPQAQLLIRLVRQRHLHNQHFTSDGYVIYQMEQQI